MDPLQFLQEYIFYTPEKKKQINEALVESQKKNPAMPAAATPTATPKEQKPRNFGIERTIREAEEDIRSGRIPSGAAGMMSGQKPTAAVTSSGVTLTTPVAPSTPDAPAIPRFADLRGSATPGSDAPAATNQGEAEAMASAETFRAGAGYPSGVDRPADYAGVVGVGTDTSTSRRDDPRNADYISARDALTPESSAADIKAVEDAGMTAWAKANPGLAAKMVAKQDKRLETNPNFKQSGYEVVRNELYPERAALAAEGNMGDFSVRDAIDGGMSPENAGTIGSGGSVETVFEPGKDPVTTSAPQQAFDLLTSYKKGLTNPSVKEAPIDKAPASMIGLDYDQVNAKMSELGGEEYLKQLDAGKFTRR